MVSGGTGVAGVVIVGGGQAGVQLTDSLRAAGWTHPITLFADEAHLPYQRPPLSKDFMAVEAGESLPLRAERFFEEADVTVHRGTRIVGINRDERVVRAADGNATRYDTLVLATGARNRGLACAGADLAGVHALRTLDDALDLQQALAAANDVVVVGAGFIGLEFAASARARGLSVTVLEFADRAMARVLSPEMSEYFARAHTASGIDLRFGEGVVGFQGDDEGVTTVVGSSGTRYPADLVLVGVGVLPNIELAEAAGLEVDNGIVVDASLRTNDAAIFALGDCARYPSRHAGGSTRLESVQNAADHARHLARVLMGDETPYESLPWFWSQQGDRKLQIAGIAAPDDHRVVRGDPAGAFAVYSFRGDTVTAVETVNSAAEHLAARRLLARGLRLAPEMVTEPGFELKAVARAADV